jgi:hypothetical protein
MADMIDAKEAKQILGCDEDTLNGHINGGAIRAQRIGGKLMVNKEDVQKVSTEQDDGTIVLTGDSDNLQIDLGKVTDDTGETMTKSKTNPGGAKRSAATDSITFGEELEVIAFDDKKGTSELAFDDSKGTTDLSFTDQNTAVMTAVDETEIGAPTAQASTSNDASGVSAANSSSDSRRSVRSNRIRVESPAVHPAWIALLALTTLIMAFFVAPFLVMSAWPRGEDKDAARNQARGVDDGFWVGMASASAGFSAEPNPARFRAINGDKEYVPNPDPAAAFRIEKYRGPLKAENEKRDSYIIVKLSDDGKQAMSKDEKGKFPITESKTVNGGVEIIEENVNIGLPESK